MQSITYVHISTPDDNGPMPKYLNVRAYSKTLRSMDLMDGFENHIEPNRIWGTDTATCRLDAAAVWIRLCIIKILGPFRGCESVFLFFILFLVWLLHYSLSRDSKPLRFLYELFIRFNVSPYVRTILFIFGRIEILRRQKN